MRGITFDGLARFIALVEFIGMYLTNNISATPMGLNNPLALESLKCFTHWSAANAHLLSELVHQETSAGYQLLVEEALEEVVVSDLPQAFAGDGDFLNGHGAHFAFVVLRSTLVLTWPYGL